MGANRDARVHRAEREHGVLNIVAGENRDGAFG